jgi:hypothetical protein
MLFVRCTSHDLNIVLNDCIQAIPQMRNVYLTECTRSSAVALEDGNYSLEKEQLSPHLKSFVLQRGVAE